MALLTFPLIDPSVAPQVGAARSIGFSTAIVGSQTGLEYRRLLQTIPRERLEGRWGYREDSRWIAEQLASFFRETAGPALPFVAFDFDYSFQHARIYVGTGDATTTVFQLPCRDTASAIVLYVDGVEQTSGITLADGLNDRKKVTFDTAPAAGTVLTASFTGQRAWVCRFTDDVLELTFDEAGGYELSVALIEVRGEE